MTNPFTAGKRIAELEKRVRELEGQLADARSGKTRMLTQFDMCRRFEKLSRERVLGKARA